MPRLTISTPVGPAVLELDPVPDARRLLVIGHGANGSIEAPDLLAVRAACLAAGISVARVIQPYRVAGKKAVPAPAILDQAWRAVIASLGRRKATAGLEFVYAGRSSGARVACRTAADGLTRPPAIGVVALAFPLHPPGRPDKSRLPELAGVGVPVLVVQGTNDAFGMPESAPGRRVEQVPGDHGLKRGTAAIGRLVAEWIDALPAPPR
ncbi:alpha/beta family hydrolase [Jatrophihabitans sp.]|uniref:alpha/beta hydrolase family protein n=1 Tax=Jatrophihabitans sp. TaxID=1932789 RepID=UPI002BE185E7|nr:alpha/beta family hydrolase [Jatrophihabitans sp.]